MAEEQKSIIEGAYLMGFEPSADDLTPEALFEEAREFIGQLSIQY